MYRKIFRKHSSKVTYCHYWFYGYSTWGTAWHTIIESLSKLQKWAVRIILQAEYRIPSVAMFRELEWLSVPKRIAYNKAVFIYIAWNNLNPACISNLLIPISTTHNHAGHLKMIPRSWTALYDRSFSSSAPKLWNSLRRTIRTSPSLNDFKLALKHYI